MPLPRKLRNFNVFVDGRGQLGVASEVVPATLTVATEDFRGAGMDVTAEIDMGMEAITFDVTFAEYVEDVVRLFGKRELIPVTLRGAATSDAATQSIVIAARGYMKEWEPGTWKPGEGAMSKHTFTCRYYRVDIDGRTDVEIDVDNMVRIVDGVDQLAEQRTALGI